MSETMPTGRQAETALERARHFFNETYNLMRTSGIVPESWQLKDELFRASILDHLEAQASAAQPSQDLMRLSQEISQVNYRVTALRYEMLNAATALRYEMLNAATPPPATTSVLTNGTAPMHCPSCGASLRVTLSPITPEA